VDVVDKIFYKKREKDTEVSKEQFVAWLWRDA
jgi:hypothetical protein